jgi:hypothetical protein
MVRDIDQTHLTAVFVLAHSIFAVILSLRHGFTEQLRTRILYSVMKSSLTFNSVYEYFNTRYN